MFFISFTLNPQIQTQSKVFHLISYFDRFLFFWFFVFCFFFFLVCFKVLELGIVFHSVIIGVDMGASQSVTTIRPLLVALSFHQFFEGVGLGGCIAQVWHKMVQPYIASYSCSFQLKKKNWVLKMISSVRFWFFIIFYFKFGIDCIVNMSS